MDKKRTTKNKYSETSVTNIHYNRVDVLRDQGFINRLWDNNPDMLKYSEKALFDIIREVNVRIGEVIATTRHGVALPLQMGVIFAGTYGKREEPVDIAASRKAGKKIRHTNHHSDGYGARIYYVTQVTKARFAIGRYWGLVPSDSLSKQLCRAYREDWKKYVHIPSLSRASRIFKEAKKREYAQKIGREYRRDYNEFEFD